MTPLWGATQAEAVQDADGISCEVIDLRTLMPWDRETVGEALLYLHHQEMAV